MRQQVKRSLARMSIIAVLGSEEGGAKRIGHAYSRQVINCSFKLRVPCEVLCLKRTDNLFPYRH